MIRYFSNNQFISPIQSLIDRIDIMEPILPFSSDAQHPIDLCRREDTKGHGNFRFGTDWSLVKAPIHALTVDEKYYLFRNHNKPFAFKIQGILYSKRSGNLGGGDFLIDEDIFMTRE